MTQEFDVHAAIKELAEAELRCSHAKVQAWDTPEGIAQCQDCSGTRRVVLFAVLRVIGPCPDECDCEPEKHTGRGWVPEPDVEKAVARILENRATHTLGEWDWFIKRVFHAIHYDRVDFKTAVLRVAVAWKRIRTP